MEWTVATTALPRTLGAFEKGVYHTLAAGDWAPAPSQLTPKRPTAARKPARRIPDLKGQTRARGTPYPKVLPDEERSGPISGSNLCLTGMLAHLLGSEKRERLESHAYSGNVGQRRRANGRSGWSAWRHQPDRWLRSGPSTDVRLPGDCRTLSSATNCAAAATRARDMAPTWRAGTRQVPAGVRILKSASGPSDEEQDVVIAHPRTYFWYPEGNFLRKYLLCNQGDGKSCLVRERAAATAKTWVHSALRNPLMVSNGSPGGRTGLLRGQFGDFGASPNHGLIKFLRPYGTPHD